LAAVGPDVTSRQALVLFSGGPDSTVCLAWALSRFERVETIGFDYGQRHRIELDCRLTVRGEISAQFPQWAPRLGDDHLLDLALLGDAGEWPAEHLRARAQPAVPDLCRGVGLPA
jgi:7-cyano-7-deazaguanine synthase